MRTSGGRGNEGWILCIPLLALLVVASLATGGPDGLFLALEGTLRQTAAAVAGFLRDLF